MGTTLALSGAYNLAGALSTYPTSLDAAFEMYERNMRPTVAKAQKLPPGMPHLIHPETEWGVWFMHVIMWTIGMTGIADLLARFAGPPAGEVPVEEYGFRDLEELKV